MDAEIWVTITACPEYEVSTHGRVRNRKRNKIKVLSQRRNGYLQTTLFVDHTPRYRLVHRLVAEAFVANPRHKKCVNHIDGVKINNHQNNLEWVTAQENTQHGLAMGLLTRGEDRYNAKLTEADVRAIRASAETLNAIANKYPVSITTIWNIKHRISWKHLG